MRILLCLLTLVAAPAWAEWVEAAESDNAISYVDTATIRKNGNFRKAWNLQDLKKRAKTGEMSRRVLFEYDCKENRARILSFTAHSEPMAGGETLYMVDDTSKWSYIAPETNAASNLKFACTK